MIPSFTVSRLADQIAKMRPRRGDEALTASDVKGVVVTRPPQLSVRRFARNQKVEPRGAFKVTTKPDHASLNSGGSIPIQTAGLVGPKHRSQKGLGGVVVRLLTMQQLQGVGDRSNLGVKRIGGERRYGVDLSFWALRIGAETARVE